MKSVAHFAERQSSSKSYLWQGRLVHCVPRKPTEEEERRKKASCVMPRTHVLGYQVVSGTGRPVGGRPPVGQCSKALEKP